jgi:F-type H+-transporting ATPase subunit b
MRRATLAFALGLAFVSCAFPQQSENKSNPAAETGDPWIVWKWVNFAILAAGLGYLIGKQAPAYFKGRTDEIQQALNEAKREIKDAETRAASIEARLAGVQSEVESLRSAARAEMSAEGERIRLETERQLKRVQNQATQEIELLTRASRSELRNYSAGLAIDLAEQRLRTGINADAQNGLVDGFLQDLSHRARPGVRT